LTPVNSDNNSPNNDNDKDDDQVTTAATPDNIEPSNAANQEENEIRLEGFGSESHNSISEDDDDDGQEEQDDNAYFRDQLIAEENKRYTPRKSNQQHELDLELTPDLKQTGIVNRFGRSPRLTNEDKATIKRLIKEGREHRK
jgi:hypothetical protein